MSEHRNERQRVRSGANLGDERSREEQGAPMTEQPILPARPPATMSSRNSAMSGCAKSWERR
jgi:hypothetical protein